MKKPGQADTLVKIASLGGGGVAVAKSWSDTAKKTEKTKKSLKKLKASEGSWQKFKADNERRKKSIRGEKMKDKKTNDSMDKSLRKKMAVKKLTRVKSLEEKMATKKAVCTNCGGKGCSRCKGY